MKNSFLKAGLSCIFLLSGLRAGAQYTDVIRALRPGQTVIPFTVGTNVLQVHAAVDAGGDNGFGKYSTGGFQNRNAIFCYGLSEKFELDAAVEIRRDKRVEHHEANKTTGLSFAAIGARCNFYESTNAWPSVGAELFLKMPVLSEGYATTYIAPKALLTVAESCFKDKLLITLNLGMEYDGVSVDKNSFYVFGLFYSVAPNWGIFAEQYGSRQSSVFYKHADFGVWQIINKDLQIDVSAGIGRIQDKTDTFVSLGFSYRAFRHGRGRG